MIWSVIRLIFKTSSVTPDFFFTFLILFYHFLPAAKVLKKSVCGNLWARTSLMLIFLLILEKCILTEISSRNSMSGAGKRQQTVCRWLSVARVFLRTKVWHSCRIYRITWPRSRWVQRWGQRGTSTFIMPYARRQKVRCFSRREKKNYFLFIHVVSHAGMSDRAVFT